MEDSRLRIRPLSSDERERNCTSALSKVGRGTCLLTNATPLKQDKSWDFDEVFRWFSLRG